MLAPANVQKLYATATTLVDLQAQQETLILQPQMAVHDYRPPGGGIQRWAVALDWIVTASSLFADAVSTALDPLDDDGWFVALFEDSSPSGTTGLMIPAQVSDHPAQNLMLPNDRVASSTVVFEPRRAAKPLYIQSAATVANGLGEGLRAPTGAVYPLGRSDGSGWRLTTTAVTLN